MAEAERKDRGARGGGHRRRNLPPRHPPTPPRPPSTAVPSDVAATIVYGRGAGMNNYANVSSDLSSLGGGYGNSTSNLNCRTSDGSADGSGGGEGGRVGGGGRRLRWSDAATNDGGGWASSTTTGGAGGWNGGSRLTLSTDAGDRPSSHGRVYRPSTTRSGGIISGGESSRQMGPITEATNYGGGVGGGGDDAASSGSSRRGRGCCSCGGPSPSSSARARTRRRNGRIMEFLTRWSQRRAWLGTVLLSTVILIFGPSFQILALPSSSDFAVAVIFSIVAVVLIVDIILCGIVDPNYFLWYCPLCDRCDGCNKERSCCFFHASRLNKYPVLEGGRNKPKHCMVGSFVFWLDVISVVSFLPEIQFLVPSRYALNTSEIFLGENELPKEGLAWSFEIYVPFETVLVIGRAARLGKFIRSSTVILVSKSFYSLTRNIVECNPFNPFRPCRDGSLVNAVRSAIRRVCACMLCVDGEADAEAVRASVTLQRWWRAVTSGAGATSSSATIGRRQEGAFSSVGSPSSVASSGTTAATAAKKTSLLREGMRRSTHAISQRRSARKARRTAKKRRYRYESQVGTAMRELTGRRVGVGIMVALILTVVLTYREPDASYQYAMVMLHDQTRVDAYSARALDAARHSAAPGLYEYRFANGTKQVFPEVYVDGLRDREKLLITVTSPVGNITTSGMFEIREAVKDLALTQIVVDVFILLIWIIGVLSFAGPIMTLVVTPIERMVRLLYMLTRDPLGYQSTPRFKQLMDKEYEIVKSTYWEEDVLKGMETSFLMSTILRIGSLMSVGFGSAGVEIIRNAFQKKGSQFDGFALNQRGSTVSRIFLFCDIRQFTDATEALQEEVFVFTNKIALVVHSICHSYGGYANKNVGDAFLLSWRLDDAGTGSVSGSMRSSGHWGDGSQHGNSFLKGMDSQGDQADRALFSVVKICMALYDDDKFLEDMSSLAKEKLLEKTSRRKGPVVQMGFGLHAGTAVQGPIGSQRKIDPTYVAESVERAEVLESLTKRYGLKVLMSDAFHELLNVNTGRRCRKIDQLLLNSDEDCLDVLDVVESGETMEVFTFDMDIDALHVDVPRGSALGSKEQNNEQGGLRRRRMSRKGSFSEGTAKFASMSKSLRSSRRPSFNSSTLDRRPPSTGIEILDRGGVACSDTNLSPRFAAMAHVMHGEERSPSVASTTGLTLYDASVWVSQEMRTIRKRYTDGLFFQTFNSGLNSYFGRDWDHARSCFLAILERFEDGPSRYFLNIIEENNCIPPAGFNGYGHV